MQEALALSLACDLPASNALLSRAVQDVCAFHGEILGQVLCNDIMIN